MPTKPTPPPAPARFEVHKYRGGHAQIVGYARVSTRDQSLAAQLAQLKDAGCCRVYAEKCSSVGARPGWLALCEALRPGDTVAVVRLDRIGRRLGEVVECCESLGKGGAFVRSIAQGIDTRGPSGRHILPLWAALAETERSILLERTRAGLEAARAMGKVGGRPRKRTPAKDALAQHLHGQGYSLQKIADELGLGKSTVKRALGAHQSEDPRQMKLLDLVDSVRGEHAEHQQQA
jgi:DNA invertase Pin-like site-specific DNA recombinase